MKKSNYSYQVVTMLLIVVSILGCQDCGEIRGEAKDLKGDHQKCESGDTCVIIDMESVVGSNSCLLPFQCPTSLNEMNIDRFRSKAKDLADDYGDCDECAQAGCASLELERAFCNEETGLCDTQVQE